MTSLRARPLPPRHRLPPLLRHTDVANLVSSLLLLPVLRAIVAILPSALCSAACAAVPFGVLNSKGCCHLRSGLWSTGLLQPSTSLPRPRSHPNSAPSP